MNQVQIQLPQSIHEKVVTLARKEGMSLDQFLVNAISNEIIRQETHAFFRQKTASFNESDFMAALAEIPASSPEEIDEI